MTCPVCGAETQVVDSRADVDVVARKRKCVSCRYVFYTEEIETPGAQDEFNRIYLAYKKDLENDER